jgi:hypothetical protein
MEEVFFLHLFNGITSGAIPLVLFLDWQFLVINFFSDPPASSVLDRLTSFESFA